METQRKFAWIKQQPDTRDYQFEDHFKFSLSSFPASYDLRTLYECPAPYDQGALGSCTANAVGFNYHFCEVAQQNTTVFTPARLYIYYNTRFIQGNTTSDNGASLRDSMKSLVVGGACDEKIWPYVTTKFRNRPDEVCYKQGDLNKALQYISVKQDMTQLKTALTSGFPVCFGFAVYSSFGKASSTGLVSVPDKTTETYSGGHAVSLVGYDDAKVMPDNTVGAWIVRNSWGANWGDKGYFYMPYRYLTDPSLASDFWILSKVSPYGPAPATSTPAPLPTEQIMTLISSIKSELSQVNSASSYTSVAGSYVVNVRGMVTSLLTYLNVMISQIGSIQNLLNSQEKTINTATTKLAVVPTIQQEVINIQNIVKPPVV
jgi:Cysteine protease